MVVRNANIHNIMGGMESTGGVRLHNHRRKLKQRFDIIRKLGQGTYGKVQLGINKETGQEVAIKTIKKAKIETEADLVRIRREIQIMSSVQHPNIIHIYEVFENREKMVLVMEYAAGGELYDYLSERKVLAQDEARRIFRQIATAVYYCHKHKICHRDLKLENILLDEHGSAKIADFGLSNVFDEQRLLSTFCGSPLYASPEIVKGTPYHGPEVDCWSLGVLLYTLVYGAMPFDGSNFKRLVKQISMGDYFEPKVPSPASTLIRDMLTVSPGKRADIEKVCSHWWVNEGYNESCLQVAEELANQTPVRLDLLLSLSNPPSGEGTDSVLVPEEQANTVISDIASGSQAVMPARCHSVGSLMELDHVPLDHQQGVPTRPVPADHGATASANQWDPVKRKLEEGVSTGDARGGARKKERGHKKDVEGSFSRQTSLQPESNVQGSGEESMEVEEIPLPELQDSPKTTLEESPKQAVPAIKDDSSNKQNDFSSHNNPSEVTSNIKPPAVTENQAEGTQKNMERSGIKNKEKSRKSVKKKESKVEDVLEKSVKKENAVKESDKLIEKPKKPILNDSEIPDTVTKGGVNENREVTNIESKPSENSLTDNSTTGRGKAELENERLKGIGKNRDLSQGKCSSSTEKISGTSTPEETPPMTLERRRSKIFETAEKFNSILAGAPETKVSPREKPKKLFIPGVKVSDAKRAFERKLSNPEVSIPGRKFSLKSDDSDRSPSNKESPVQEPFDSFTGKPKTPQFDQKVSAPNSQKSFELEETMGNEVIPDAQDLISPNENKDELLRNVSGILNLQKQKDESVIIKKNTNAGIPASRPVSGGEIVSESAVTGPAPGDSVTSGEILHMKSPTAMQTAFGSAEVKHTAPQVPASNKTATDIGANEDKIGLIANDNQTSIPKNKTSTNVNSEDVPGKKKSSKVEIVLKSATLPRRKTSKAEIRLEPKVQPIEFKTEVQHLVNAVPDVASPQLPNKKQAVAENAPLRSWSLEPESTQPNRIPIRECIIPIQIEQENKEAANSTTPLGRPPLHPMQQRALSQQQRSSNLSRQSTQESDSEVMEPIRKSPREYIIPIAMEGGGYITPRAGSLEPSLSEDGKEKQKQLPSLSSNHFRRMSSLLSDNSEDEGFNSASVTLPRHGSLSRDGDDGRMFHFHKLRSSRPFRRSLERNDSLSSAEEDEDDDDDEGFEILTAESLFSTLLSRVRSLTQRLTVEDGKRTGFPTSHLMNQLVNSGQTSPSWKTTFSHHTEPLSRRLSETSTFPRLLNRGRDLPVHRQRSLSRDPSDSDSVYSEASSGTRAFPRGPPRQKQVITGCNTPRRGTRSLSLSHQSNPDFTSGYDLHNKHNDDLSNDKYYTSEESCTRNSGLSIRNFPTVSNIHNSSRQDSSLPRKLTRTMSLRATEEKSRDHLYDNPYSPSFMRKKSYTNDLASVDHYSPPYVSLRTRNANVLPQRYSSTSDLRESKSKDSVSGYVLPPLPQNYKSVSRYRDSSIPRALPSSGKLQGFQSHHNSYSLKETDFKHQPKHSSSLPSIAEREKNAKMNKTDNKSKRTSENQGINCYNNTAKLNENTKQDSLVNSERYEDSSNVASSTSKGVKPIHKIGSPLTDSGPRLLQRSLSQNYENNKAQTTSSQRGTSKALKYGTSKHLTTSNLLEDKPKEPNQNTSVNESQTLDNDDEKGKQKRRISRFLRPDFFDTPPEESSYVKEREALKAVEAEKKKAKRIARRSALIEASKDLVSKNKTNSDVELPENFSDSGSKALSSNNFKDTTADANATDFNSSQEENQISLNVQDSKALNHKNNDDQCQNKTSPEKGFKTVGANLGPLTSTGKSRVGKAISSLQERSFVSQNNPTESMYLKRAVSVDDVSLKSHVSPPRSNTRLGRKISSVLGLFSRKESISTEEQQTGNPETGRKLKRPSRSSTCELTGISNSNESKPQLSNNLGMKKDENVLKPNEGKLKLKPKSKDESHKTLISPDKVKSKSGGSSQSKLGAQTSKSSSSKKNAEESHNKTKSNCSSSTVPEHDTPLQNSLIKNTKVISEENKPEENTQILEKKLDSNNSSTSLGQILDPVNQAKQPQVAEPQNSSSATVHDQCLCSISSKNPNTLSLPKDLDSYFSQSPAASSLNSPADEVESIDSWTVCSDTEICDTSVQATSEGEGSESVEDRIRRKSFYLRFNDLKKKKPKKSSLLLKQGRNPSANPQPKTSDSQSSLATSIDPASVISNKNLPENADYSEAQNTVFNKADNEKFLVPCAKNASQEIPDNKHQQGSTVKKKKSATNTHASLSKEVTAPMLPDISIPRADQNNTLKVMNLTPASTSVLSDVKDTSTPNNDNLTSSSSKENNRQLSYVHIHEGDPSS